MRFVVWTPNFVKNCGGIRALHSLAYELKARGCEVELANSTNTDPEKSIPFYNKHMNNNTIAIYPEIIPDNPIHATKIVRWLLAPIGKEWMDYRKGDQIYSWSGWYGLPILYTPIIDVRFFNSLGGESSRSGILTYKAPRVPGDIEITDNYPENWTKLAELFRTAEYLRCGDNNTALMIEARLCSCPVLMTSPDLFTKYVGGNIGVAHSLEELPTAKETIKDMWTEYHKYVDEGFRSIDMFIIECKEKWE
jgi:hypothetical protein